MSQRPAAMLPALLALLPALVLSAWTRAHWEEPQSEVEASAADRVPAEVVLEVLIAEGGYRLRVTRPDHQGLRLPLRSARRTRLSTREAFIPRAPGFPPDLVVTAALTLLREGESPLVQLRAEDSLPWARILEAGDALEPLLGSHRRAESQLAGLLLDARP